MRKNHLTRKVWDYIPGTDMWSIYRSESWFWTDHGASTVRIPEYGRDGRDQRAHERDQSPRNDTVNRQETRNSWKDCSWHCAQSGYLHMCVQGRIHYRPQNGKGLLSQPRQGIEHRYSIFRSRTFAPAPSAMVFNLL